MSYNAELEFALEAARAVSEPILSLFQSPDLKVEDKADSSPVSEADRLAEQTIRKMLEARFPEDGIIGEEFGVKKSTNGRTWTIDPIDGTHPFINGNPQFGTLIGLKNEEETLVGVINMPAMAEAVYAARGEGCHWLTRGQLLPAKCRHTGSLSTALYCDSSPTYWEKHGKWEYYSRLAKKCHNARGWGDCYGYLLVATGRADLMTDPYFEIWDACPLQVIIEEAGGVFTDLNGNRNVSGNEGGLACATRSLHTEVLGIFR